VGGVTWSVTSKGNQGTDGSVVNKGTTPSCSIFGYFLGVSRAVQAVQNY